MIELPVFSTYLVLAPSPSGLLSCPTSLSCYPFSTVQSYSPVLLSNSTVLSSPTIVFYYLSCSPLLPILLYCHDLLSYSFCPTILFYYLILLFILLSSLLSYHTFQSNGPHLLYYSMLSPAILSRPTALSCCAIPLSFYPGHLPNPDPVP
jgi:hypothetical protein